MAGLFRGSLSLFTICARQGSRTIRCCPFLLLGCRRAAFPDGYNQVAAAGDRCIHFFTACRRRQLVFVTTPTHSARADPDADSPPARPTSRSSSRGRAAARLAAFDPRHQLTPLIDREDVTTS